MTYVSEPTTPVEEDPRVPTWTLADRLRKSLQHSGVTLSEMGAELEVHPNTVSGYCSGRNRPSRPMVIAWSFRTGVDLGWLLTGEATPPSDVPEGLRDLHRRCYLDAFRSSPGTVLRLVPSTANPLHPEGWLAVHTPFTSPFPRRNVPATPCVRVRVRPSFSVAASPLSAGAAESTNDRSGEGGPSPIPTNVNPPEGDGSTSLEPAGASNR